MRKRMKVFSVNGTKIKVLKQSYKKGDLCCEVLVKYFTGVKANIETTLNKLVAQ